MRPSLLLAVDLQASSGASLGMKLILWTAERTQPGSWATMDQPTVEPSVLGHV